MNGRFVLWLVVLGGLFAAGYLSTKPYLLEDARIWAEQKITGADPLYSPDQFEIDLVDRINYLRKNAKQPMMKVDVELEKWMKDFSESIKADDLDSFVELIQNQQPRYFQVRVGSAHAPALPELAEQFKAFTSSIEAENEHMGVLVRKKPSGFGFEAVLVTGQRLMNFSPEALNEHTRDTFFSVCPHCKHQHACRAVRSNRGINLDCPRCGLDYGVLAPDANGQFRYVNEYLTGFQPPAHYAADSSRLHELYTIWNAVVDHCTYTKDSTPVNPTRDAWQTGLETLTRGKGDCEDSAVLLADWLISRGFDARVALGRFGDMGQHAWCVVRLDGIEYLLESTEGHRNMEKPAYATELGARYVPDTMFDRDAIYVRSRPRDRFDGIYWSAKSWIRIQPRRLFDTGLRTMPALASAANDGRPRNIVARRQASKDPAGIPMPAFDRLKDLSPGLDRWQFTAPIAPLPITTAAPQ
jgi:hypothetical protein